MGCHKCEMEQRMKTDQKKIWFVPLDHCDSCDQPDRIKREGHHLTLDDFSDNPTAEQRDLGGNFISC